MFAGKVLVAQGGGPTAVINQSMAGVVLEARKFRNVERVYGAYHGVRGIINEDLLDLTQETSHNIEMVANTPSSALGSTRDKPDLKYCHEIFTVLRAHGIGYFFYIGGNDSSDTVRIVSEEARAANYPLRCIHIPKTIDNDLVGNDHTPGFPSEARFVAQAFMGANLDNAQGNAYGTASGNLEQGQINGSFTTVAVDTLVDGTTQQAAARAAGITEFARPEDGHWADAKTFYFVTTGADPDNIANVGNGPIATQTARLYKLTFADGVNGEVDYDSGQVNMVLDSSSLVGTDGAAARSFDNMVVADNGDILIQEDPGNTSYIAKTWLYKNGVAA